MHYDLPGRVNYVDTEDTTSNADSENVPHRIASFIGARTETDKTTNVHRVNGMDFLGSLAACERRTAEQNSAYIDAVTEFRQNMLDPSPEDEYHHSKVADYDMHPCNTTLRLPVQVRGANACAAIRDVHQRAKA